jgi:uncharacterized SAM-binding protein YcdF (DUF218 family)
MRRSFIPVSAVSLFLIAAFVLSFKSASQFLIISTPLHKADAIVLLGGDHERKIPVAADLYRRGYANRIFVTDDGIFSSWSQKYKRNLYASEWAVEKLDELGVPRTAIEILPHLGDGTVYEAVVVRYGIMNTPLKSLIIVADDYHTRRALNIFTFVLRNQAPEIMTASASTDFSMPERLLTFAQECLKSLYYEVRYIRLGKSWPLPGNIRI